MKQLRQAGYTGDVLGNSGASAGNLKPAGADGAGMVWPVDFNYQMSAPSSQKFAKAYQAGVRRAAAQLRRRGLRRGVVPRQVDQAGRQRRPGRDQGRHGVVAKEKFDGALGTGLTWKDRDLQVPGVVVRWNGTGEDLLYEATGTS
jgi:branched-chain amino acid transport system substrate-binding protein